MEVSAEKKKTVSNQGRSAEQWPQMMVQSKYCTSHNGLKENRSHFRESYPLDPRRNMFPFSIPLKHGF